MRPASLVIALILAGTHAANAEDAHSALQQNERDAVYPIQLVGTMALGPSGADGRWGLSFERHPMRGFGVGVGAAAGYAVVGETSTTAPREAVWMSFGARIGHYFAHRGDATMNGVIGVALAPIVDVTMNADARLAVTAQPGFVLSVEHFTFGLSMLLGAALVPEPGFYVGVLTGIGFTI